jgi:hypothetical protein
MADDGDTFSVLSIDDLKRAGVHIEDFSEMTKSIHSDLFAVVNKYPNPGGDGDVGKSFAVNYAPAADAILEFLAALTTLLSADGSKTGALGGLFDDVNNKASDTANGGHGGGRH